MRSTSNAFCNILSVVVILVSIGFQGGVSGKSLALEGRKVDACDQVATWEQITHAESIDGSIVQLVQHEESGPQVFYSVRCRAEFYPCRGIEAGIRSRCETRFNPIAAIVVDETAPNGMKWDVVLVPGQCACAEFVNTTIS
ncbi:hypothetical protein FO519_000627 [Halicephalobus sp. NKZ332]|nr:hypothetical protein FO519_000627 [Halicephalobus sp. NKZ332]